MSTTTPPLSPADQKKLQKDLEDSLRAQISISGLQASLARNRRDIAIFNKEALEANIQVYHVRGQLRELALSEGVVTKEELEKAQQEAPAPMEN